MVCAETVMLQAANKFYRRKFIVFHFFVNYIKLSNDKFADVMLCIIMACCRPNKLLLWDL